MVITLQTHVILLNMSKQTMEGGERVGEEKEEDGGRGTTLRQ